MKKIFIALFVFASVSLFAEPVKVTYVDLSAYQEAYNAKIWLEYHWTYVIDEDGPYYLITTPTYTYKFCETKEGAMSSLNCYYVIDTKQLIADRDAGVQGKSYIIETKRIPDSKKAEMWTFDKSTRIFTFTRLNLTFILK